MNDIRIRAAVAADARTIARVHVRAWRESYRGLVPDQMIEALSVERNGRMWADILTAGNSPIVHVVERLGGSDETEIVGFGSGAGARGSELGTSGEILAIYLLDRIKRRGIGRMLLTGLLAALADRGHPSAGLWVLVDNRSARRFYETLGAHAQSQRLVIDGPADMHEVAYVWDDLSGFH
ncbi:MAG TPA: GNAT family N-acetyltransferase [Xanthobacteraceae bacterium]